MIKLLHKLFVPYCIGFLYVLVFNISPAFSQQSVIKKTSASKKITHKSKSVHHIRKPVAPLSKSITTIKAKQINPTVIFASTPDTIITASGSLSICSGFYVTLTANHLPHPDTVQWYYNNALIAKATNASYDAYQAGTYFAKSAGYTYTSVVVVVNPLPTAKFTFTGANQCASVPIVFTDASSGSGLTYSWNFGDASSGSSNSSTAKNPIHKFIGTPGPGTQSFTVTLTVTTAQGCSASYSATVTTQRPTDTNLGPSTTLYNGQNYFTGCGTGPAMMTFTNISSTQSINKSYRIIWGDKSADFTATSFISIQHTYAIGTYNLTYIIANVDGCIDTANYKVFVGSNPAVGLNNPGNTAICTSSTLIFPVTGTENNPPGTTYTVTFDDGSPSIIYQSSPDTLQHTFLNSSCGTTSGPYANSFSATIVASNPCSSSTANVYPIYVSQKPVAAFIASRDAVCTTHSATFDNTSLINNVSNQGCTPGNILWSITPAKGWVLANGETLGNDFGLTDPDDWQSGSQEINIQFNTAGTYTIKLKTGSSNCGLDSITKTVCVNLPPTSAFTTSVSGGCGPLTVKTTNTSPAPNCGVDTYQWSVSPSSGFTYTGGTSASSINPQFSFTSAGVYTISLIAVSPGGDCTSAAATQTVTVTTKPTITLTSTARSICQGTTIQPSASITGGGKLSYLWTFAGGTPSTSTSLNPGVIAYDTAGTYTASLVVTNQCSSTRDTAVVVVMPTPVAKLPANQSFCSGISTPALVLGSNVTGTTFTWKNSNTSIGLKSSGTGNIPVFTTVNNTASPVTATITVTPTDNSCTGIPSTFNITVNPLPVSPTVTPSVVYCKGEIASALSATASSGDSLNWYTNANLSNKLSGAPTPSTATEGTTTYYVTQSNSYGCESQPVTISVIVNPGITGNIITQNQTVCYNTSPTTLVSAATLGGGDGSYIYQWQILNGTTWANIPNAVNSSYSPGNLTATTK